MFKKKHYDGGDQDNAVTNRPVLDEDQISLTHPHL